MRVAIRWLNIHAASAGFAFASPFASITCTTFAAAEARKLDAEAELAANGSDHVLVQQLYAELETLNGTLDRDMERWAELAELAG